MWLVFWLDYRRELDLYEYGILPRNLKGLIGIILSPLIHGDLRHIGNNSLPVLVLGSGLFYFYPKEAKNIVGWLWLLTGAIVWIIGRESYHIGASGLIYGLAGFIFLSGVLRRQVNLLAMSLLVVFLYGSMVWGVLPIEEGISWEGHVAGALSGFALALVYRKHGPRKKLYSWDLEDENESDEGGEWNHWNNGEASDTGVYTRIYYEYKENEPRLPADKNEIESGDDS